MPVLYSTYFSDDEFSKTVCRISLIIGVKPVRQIETVFQVIEWLSDWLAGWAGERASERAGERATDRRTDRSIDRSVIQLQCNSLKNMLKWPEHKTSWLISVWRYELKMAVSCWLTDWLTRTDVLEKPRKIATNLSLQQWELFPLLHWVGIL